MKLQDLIRDLKLELIKNGEKLDATNPNYLEATEAAASKYDIKVVVLPKLITKSPTFGPGTAEWLKNAQAELGKKESDPEFQKKMNPMWAKAGLPSFKGLVGSPRAWCSLFVVAALTWGGYKTSKLNAAAISGDNFGQKIEWKTQGIPKGAIVRINHSSKCTSASGNHIGFSGGDCTPTDVASGSFNMLGGNQSDKVSIAAFPVNDICSVSWPVETVEGVKIALPGKVLVSNGCKGKAEPTGSTR